MQLLSSLKLERKYDSDLHVAQDPLYILNNFYIPCLSSSTSYCRLAGFFSSSTFYVISRGLLNLVLNGGTIKLITSPHLSPEDCEAIINGSKTESEVLDSVLLRDLFDKDGFLDENAELLGWLISNGKLEIRIAVIYDYDGRILDYQKIDESAIFHHKVGIFTDSEGNKVSFDGSINETMSAWIRNGESFKVFCSWLPGQDEYVEDDVIQFNTYWEFGTHNRVKTTTLSEAVKEKWVKDLPKDIEDLTAYKKYLNLLTTNNSSKGWLEERQYQTDAVNTWVDYGYRGLFDMATGTGKTKTALLAAKRIIEDKNNQVAVVIVCPYLHLTQMWEEEIVQFGFNNYVMGHSQSPNWKDEFERKVRLFRSFPETFFFITTVNSFCKDYVQKWINKISDNVLLIVDEVHHMGSRNYSKYLNETIPYRLGLSATIKRFRDQPGTNALYDYFGNTCITYTLEMALNDGKLAPYKYFPIVCYFNDDEYVRIIAINEEINRLESSPSKDIKKIEELKVNGYRIIAKMEDKLDKLMEILEEYQNSYHMLIYCGATSISSTQSEIDAETGNSEESDRLITYLANEIYRKYGVKLRTFTCSDDLKNRKIIIDDFTKKHIQSILAIRCLDEGVNIPDIRYAFLLSSSEDPKEYIQRRGRVLRVAKDKPFSVIYDFLAFPKSFAFKIRDINNEDIEISVMLKELKRVYEFSRLSMNKEEGCNLIRQVIEIYPDVDI